MTKESEVTKPAELPDLVPLHADWQTKLNAMLAAGTSYVAASESMFCLGVQVSGTHRRFYRPLPMCPGAIS
jgi:hypothetical protein